MSLVNAASVLMSGVRVSRSSAVVVDWSVENAIMDKLSVTPRGKGNLYLRIVIFIIASLPRANESNKASYV